MSAQPKWEIKQLSTIADRIDYGHTASANAEPVGPKLLRITDIQSGRVEWNDVPYCLATTDDIRKYELMDGDIVFARTGNTTGKSFLLKSPPPNAVFASYLIRVRPGNSVEPRFLAHFFNTPNYWAQIEKNTEGAGQPGVNASRLKTLEIPLPPLSEQKRIADILDKADAIRRKRQEVQSILRKLPASVFDATFGDPLQNPYQWKTVELKHLVAKGDKINYGIVQPGNHIVDGVPVIRVGDMQHISESLADLKRVSPTVHNRHKKSTLQGDEVLLACVGSIGLVALANEQMKGFNIVRAIARIRCNLDINREYLAAYLSTPFAQNYFSRATRTVSQPTLNIKQIEETPILVPPKTLQDEFVSYLSANHRVSDRCSLASHQSITLFDSLVQLAFNAELSTVAASRN